MRVCADPNNLPFSNEAREGFENRIVELIAQELDADVTYYWHAQRRGFLRETLKAGNCDVVPGLPSNLEGVRTTLPYYRSSYQFVVRSSDPLPRSFNDPLLRERRVGVQLVGDDGWNTPPAHALARRGSPITFAATLFMAITASQAHPRGSSKPLRTVRSISLWHGGLWRVILRPVKRCRCRSLRSARHSTAPSFPWFGTSRSRCAKTTTGSRDEIDDVLRRRRDEVDRILAEFGVPRVDSAPSLVGEAREPRSGLLMRVHDTLCLRA